MTTLTHSIHSSSRRWALAGVAYVSSVSASVGAAAALATAGLPLDVLVAVV